jgi:hypothetical protein
MWEEYLSEKGVSSGIEAKEKNIDRSGEPFFRRVLKWLGEYKTAYILISPSL